MRSRTVLPAALLSLAAIPGAALARPDKSEAQGDPAAAPWLVQFEAAKDVRVGIDEGELTAWFKTTHHDELRRSAAKGFDSMWSREFLLQTPSWKVPEIPAFGIAKYELTNAQWARFLESRRDTHETAADDTLRAIVLKVWRITDDGRSEREITSGIKTLVVTNWAALQPALDPKADPTWEKNVDPKTKRLWDPQEHQAGATKLPAGLKLTYTRYMAPSHWADDGSVPSHERKRPMRFVSWEQGMDFCRWAGFHLPTEFEWERAARGTSGRAFPWEGGWDPLKVVWIGYNAAAIAGKKPEFPPAWTVPAMQKDPPRTTPGPLEVDQLPAGATPEGIQHMLGNVTELTLSTVTKYRDTKCTNPFTDGSTIIVRGGNYEDRAEVQLPSDRRANGHAGALLRSHAFPGLGIRLASYPVDGADLTALIADRWNDFDGLDTPAAQLPYAAGCSDSKDSKPYQGFEVQRTAGVLLRQIASESPDFAFVTGPASGIALLPVKGLPLEHVKTVDELKRCANASENPVCIGILTGTENASFEVIAPGGVKTWISFNDEQLIHANAQLVQTKEFIGAVLLLDGDKVVAYRPSGQFRKAKFRDAPLGELALPIEFGPQKGFKAPTGKLEGDMVELSTTLPFLDSKGKPGTGSMTSGIRITVKIPFKTAAPR